MANPGEVTVQYVVVKSVEKLSEVVKSKCGTSKDFWFGTFPSSEHEELANKLSSIQVGPFWAAEAFTHCYAAPSEDAQADFTRLYLQLGLGQRSSKPARRYKASGLVYVLLNLTGFSKLYKHNMRMAAAAKTARKAKSSGKRKHKEARPINAEKLLEEAETSLADWVTSKKPRIEVISDPLASEWPDPRVAVASSSSSRPHPQSHAEKLDLHRRQVMVIQKRLEELLPSLPFDELSTSLALSKLEESMRKRKGKFDAFSADVERVIISFVNKTAAAKAAADAKKPPKASAKTKACAASAPKEWPAASSAAAERAMAAMTSGGEHDRASSEPEDVQKLHERVPVPQEGPESVHTEESQVKEGPSSASKTSSVLPTVEIEEVEEVEILDDTTAEANAEADAEADAEAEVDECGFQLAMNELRNATGPADAMAVLNALQNSQPSRELLSWGAWEAMLAARERMTQYVRVARLCRKLRDRWTALDTAGHRYGRYGTAQPRVIERPEAAKETAEKEMGNTCAEEKRQAEEEKRQARVQKEEERIRALRERQQKDAIRDQSVNDAKRLRWQAWETEQIERTPNYCSAGFAPKAEWIAELRESKRKENRAQKMDASDEIRAPMRTNYMEKLIDTSVWQCPTCTLLNDEGLLACDACGCPADMHAQRDVDYGRPDENTSAPRLAGWLQQNGLEAEYGEKLEEQGYTLEDLIEADPKDVEEMLRMIHAKPGAILDAVRGVDQAILVDASRPKLVRPKGDESRVRFREDVGPKFKEGDSVEYRSASTGWIPAKVLKVKGDLYDLDCKQDVPPDRMRMTKDSESAFSSGDLVEYFSASQGKWIPAKVLLRKQDRRLDLDCKQDVVITNVRKPDVTAATSFAPGDHVEYYSSSQANWISATVRAVKAGRIDLDCKPDVLPEHVRRPLPPPGSEPLPTLLEQGQAVEYFGAKLQRWIPAKVLKRNSDGTYDLDCKTNVQPAKVRRLKSASLESSPSSTVTLAPYKEGDRVEYFSGSQSRWIPARVLGVTPEGRFHLDCKSDVPAEKIRPPSKKTLDYQVGDVVDYFGASKGLWISTKVLKINEDGTFDLACKPRVLPENMRKAVSTTEALEKGPVFNLGDSVEYFGVSQNRWIPAKVVSMTSAGNYNLDVKQESGSGGDIDGSDEID
ncbi:unnamed protein product [Durusdinium trenchii]|uniref:RanBP2-type domain-containing protein n=1 Tax=Durusdinium trenchii TaxID=1381693 RepID=A0ABP0H4W7_9DINO